MAAEIVHNWLPVTGANDFFVILGQNLTFQTGTVESFFDYTLEIIGLSKTNTVKPEIEKTSSAAVIIWAEFKRIVCTSSDLTDHFEAFKNRTKFFF